MVSVNKFWKFWKIQLLSSLNDFALRQEERDHNHQDVSFPFKAAHGLFYSDTFLSEPAATSISTLTTIALLLAGLDSLRSPTCIKEPCPPASLMSVHFLGPPLIDADHYRLQPVM